MKIKTKLLFIFILLLASYILITRSLNEAKPIVAYQTEVKDVIMSKQIELDKVKSLGDLVTLGQSFSKEYIDVDNNFFGERRTAFTLKGTYQMGIDTKHIEFEQIDNYIVRVKLPEIKLISLEIPYDQIQIGNEKGMLRKKMKEDDLKEFYRYIEDNFREELMYDEQIQLQATLFSEYAVEELVKKVAGFKEVRFVD